MAEIREKFAALGGRMSQRMNSLGDKMKEVFQGSSQADKFVEEATSEKNGFSPDWGKNLQICDMVNAEGLTGQDVVRGVKKRLSSKSPAVQLLALVLLETCVKNCEKMFAEVASEKVLDEMVKLVDDPQTSSQNRDKILRMIESWGEATEELRYLPVFEETYKSLRSRGIRFPGRDEESLAPIFTPPQSAPIQSSSLARAQSDPKADPKEVFDVARNSSELLSTVLSSSPQKEALEDDLTTALVEQCRQSQLSVHRLLEGSPENESLMFEGLQVNDELQRVLQKFEDLFVGRAPSEAAQPALPTFAAAAEEEGPSEESLVRTRQKQNATEEGSASIDKLDELVFGGKSSSSSKKNTKNSDDLITF
ncbi:TOM1-like protein 1 [Selaginella moellendorffii]|nr:TOM1-like protein 1 [Selaginella moellendorffii]|eukprot:XP_002973972.2 TOM1-like protein 1 [Selaginella moellendorffii]